MQGLSAKGFQRCARLRPQPGGFCPETGAISRIAKNRVPDMGEMHSDLVGATRLQGARDQARNRLSVSPKKAFQHLPVSDGQAPRLAHRLPVACVGMAADGCINGALRTVRCTPDQSEIAALERSFALFSELL